VTISEARTAKLLTPLMGRLDPYIPHSNGYHLEALAQAHSDAYRRYEPKPYDGRVIVVRASRQPRNVEPDPTLGWSHLITPSPTIVTVDAFHQTIMEEPQVAHVAGALELELEVGACPE
jgi:thioesterase domain-containing protein